MRSSTGKDAFILFLFVCDTEYHSSRAHDERYSFPTGASCGIFANVPRSTEPHTTYFLLARSTNFLFFFFFFFFLFFLVLRLEFFLFPVAFFLLFFYKTFFFLLKFLFDHK